MKDVSDQLKMGILLRMGFIFSMKHRILLFIFLGSCMSVCLSIVEQEMLSSFTTKASAEVTEHQKNECIIVLQAWHILQEAVFAIIEHCYCWAETFKLVCVDFPTNRKEHQAGIAYRI